MATTISTSIMFLEHDEKWKHEKPYHVLYEPPQGLEKSNLNLRQVADIKVVDVRQLDVQPTIKENGFELIEIGDIPLTSQEYDDDEKVAKILLPRAATAVNKALGSSRIQFFDTTIRRRHPQFPLHVGGSYSYHQPTSIAHVDTTEEDAEGIMRMLNPEEGEALSKKKYQWFNIWLPLVGPLRDYPLVLLDMRTVDPVTDLAHQDTVKTDVVHETYQVYNNDKHRWYFISDQMPHQAWLFIQATCGEVSQPGVPHTSFDYPYKTQSDHLRESIECRGFAFYD